MTLFLIVLLIGAAGGLVVMLRAAGRGDPTAVGMRLARYGLVSAGGAGGQGANSVITPAVRQQSEQSALSQSIERAVSRGRFGPAVRRRLEKADMQMTSGEFVVICGTIFVILMLVGLLVAGTLGLLLAGTIGLAAPWFYV